MQLIKKILFYVFIAVSFGIAIWGYFKLKESKEPTSSVLKHIPSNALCVIETKNLTELITSLTRQNLIWNELMNDSSLQKVQNDINYFDSQLKSNSELEELITNNLIYLSFIKQKNTTEALLQFKLKEKSNEIFVQQFLKTQNVQITTHKWYAQCVDGIVYFSTSTILLNEAIHLTESQSIEKNILYKQLLSLNGNQKTQFYINHHFVNYFPTSLFNKQSVFTIDIALNEISFTGYTHTDLAFYQLKQQKAIQFDLFENLPQQPNYIVGIAITNAQEFYKQKTQIKNKENLWKAINDSALYDIQHEFFENINEQTVLANYTFEQKEHGLLAIKIKDKEKAEQLISIIKDSTINQPELVYYKINENYTQLFSMIDEKQYYKYVAITANEIIFMADLKMVNVYQYSLINSLLLLKDSEFMKYAQQHLKENCNLFCYKNVGLTKHSKFDLLFNEELLLIKNKAITQLSYTVKNYKSLLQTHINISKLKKSETDNENFTNALWSFSADSTVISSINLFTNHTTQENELCFQDITNQLYLITTTGNLIWKQTLKENITSKIYTVDIFKNGKLQLLFNTETELHLIDRNGNYVQGYPVKLPAKITSPITLMDYDNNKDYRLIFACSDKKIYNYSIYGIKTDGFIPVKTEAIVEQPIVYIKVGLSDYLITNDVQGKLYGFSRKGEGRIDFKNKTIVDLKHFHIVQGNTLDNTKLIYVDDKNNLLNKISLSDKKEALKLGDELNGFKTSFDIVNEDNKTDALVYGDGAIYGYDLFSSKLIEYFNTNAVYENVQTISTSLNNYLLAYDKVAHQLEILNTEGKLIKVIKNVSSKPLISNLYKNGKIYMLLTSNNTIRCVELD